MLVMVAYVRQMTSRKICKHGKYELFGHLFFLLIVNIIVASDTGSDCMCVCVWVGGCVRFSVSVGRCLYFQRLCFESMLSVFAFES